MRPVSWRGLQKGHLVPRSLLIHIRCNSHMLHLAHLSLEAVLRRQWHFLLSVIYSGSFKGDVCIYLMSVNNAEIHRTFPFVKKWRTFSISNSSISGKELILEDICIGWPSKTNYS